MFKERRPYIKYKYNWEKTGLFDDLFSSERKDLVEISAMKKIDMAGNIKLETDDIGLNELLTIYNEPAELDGNQSVLIRKAERRTEYAKVTLERRKTKQAKPKSSWTLFDVAIQF